MLSIMTNETVVQLLKQKLGERTQVELARELQVSPQYIHDVLCGNRKPSDKILEYVGLKWEIVKAKK